MPLRQVVDVRADFNSDGKIVPLAYNEENNKTMYIKGILKVQKSVVAQKKIQITFFCRSAEKDVRLIFVNNIWYLEKED